MTKNEIQRKIIDTVLEADFRGIVLASVRSGKTRILLTSIKEHSQVENPKVIVFYPNIDIKNSWIDECNLIGCPMDITYCTFMSMEKYVDEKFDYYIFDEAHLIPEEHKLPIAGKIAKENKNVIFASGTYNRNTLANIIMHTELDMIIDYSTEEAIEDDLITNYTIYVHKYKLDTERKVLFSSGKRKWTSTDEKECNRLTKRMENTFGETKILAALSRMRFINSNTSLFVTVNDWIKRNMYADRFIMFTDNEKFGSRFKLPMFNSKSKTNEILEKFKQGELNQLCLIKKGSAGVTFPNLRNVIVTAVNSNGENLEQIIGRALLKDTEFANIHIFISDKEFQLKWLNSALSNINKDKIVWLEACLDE